MDPRAEPMTARDQAAAAEPLRSLIDVATGGEPRRRRTQKTSERVAGEIVRDIVARGLGSGARLPLEVAMAAQYDVSRSSLREALRILEVQGLIRLKPGPGGGPVVGVVEAANLARTASLYFHLGGASYRDLIETQAMLEPLCAIAAAGNPDRAAAMAPHLEPAPVDDLERYHRETVAFHQAIYELAANPVLRLLTEAITQMVTSHVLASIDPVELHASIVAEHAAIAAAVADGDKAAAHRLTAEHFGAQHDYYRRTMPARLTQLIEWR
jgi:GntR family transcriptional regulator, transcriptional repressor for pyruvate dehydrogenase complex